MAHKVEDKRLTITVEQAARMLGISRGLAYQMARQGSIPTLRFGKRIVVPKKAIERLLEESGAANSHQLSKEKSNPKGSRNSRGQLLNRSVRPRKHVRLEN